MDKVLTLPDASATPTSIRAKALVFHDPGSLLLLDHVERIARSEATVLVIGETGTGKELIARHIHTVSGRSGPFVAVNCGAFSEALIDAELFGHESGAYTGASQSRAGWFEAAQGGSLFLDEIGDLPLSLQVKLLRVLQERQVVRLGSRRTIPLDVRLIAATNIDLARAVSAQHFRADLYYRLSVASIRLPPLRERPADILPLARHFVTVYSARLKLGEIALSEHAEATLLNYAWPGNIRELENAIHYALIVCRDGVIQAEDIKTIPFRSAPEHLSVVPHAPVASAFNRVDAHRPEEPTPTRPAEPPAAAAMDQLIQAWKVLLVQGRPDLFDEVEAVLVRVAFAHAAENQVRTAKILGITRNTLRTFLKRHGLLRVSRESRLDVCAGSDGGGDCSAAPSASA